MKSQKETMNKLLNKLIQLLKRNKKTEAPIAPPPRPKVKRQNAVPTLKNKEMPKKYSEDKKVSEAKRKAGEVKATEDKKPDAIKAKKKKYYRYKKFKGKKPISTEGKSTSSK
jgi:hypothetical protein